MDCCPNRSFRLLEELGHAESVDFDLVQCSSCGAHVMRTWSEHRPDMVFNEPMTGAQATEFRASEGLERRRLLKRWFDEH